MQVLESEIVIPLPYYKAIYRRNLIQTCIFIVFSIGSFSYLIVSSIQTFAILQTHARINGFLKIEAMFRGEVTLGFVGLFLAFLVYGMLLFFMIRQWRRPTPQIRISHEGIYFSFYSLLIRWEEIKELSLFCSSGTPYYLGIVPWNAESVFLRVRGLSGRFHRLIYFNLSRFFRGKPPFCIPQMISPIPLDELMTAIQEHFATELREHHITVLVPSLSM